MATNTMQLGLVEEMVSNYKNKQYKSIINSIDNPMVFDAQSIWFRLDSLKEFIKVFETEVAKHPEYDLKDFGIRFYYSAYPDSANWGAPGHEDLISLSDNPNWEEYGKLHTLIGIPTARINGVNSDFNPYDTKTYTGCKPEGEGLAIMAENHGNLVPPDTQVSLWF